MASTTLPSPYRVQSSLPDFNAEDIALLESNGRFSFVSPNHAQNLPDGIDEQTGLSQEHLDLAKKFASDFPKAQDQDFPCPGFDLLQDREFITVERLRTMFTHVSEQHAKHREDNRALRAEIKPDQWTKETLANCTLLFSMPSLACAEDSFSSHHVELLSQDIDWCFDILSEGHVKKLALETVAAPVAALHTAYLNLTPEDAKKLLEARNSAINACQAIAASLKIRKSLAPLFDKAGRAILAVFELTQRLFQPYKQIFDKALIPKQHNDLVQRILWQALHDLPLRPKTALQEHLAASTSPLWSLQIYCQSQRRPALSLKPDHPDYKKLNEASSVVGLTIILARTLPLLFLQMEGQLHSQRQDAQEQASDQIKSNNILTGPKTLAELKTKISAANGLAIPLTNLEKDAMADPVAAEIETLKQKIASLASSESTDETTAPDEEKLQTLLKEAIDLSLRAEPKTTSSGNLQAAVSTAAAPLLDYLKSAEIRHLADAADYLLAQGLPEFLPRGCYLEISQAHSSFQAKSQTLFLITYCSDHSLNPNQIKTALQDFASEVTSEIIKDTPQQGALHPTFHEHAAELSSATIGQTCLTGSDSDGDGGLDPESMRQELAQAFDELGLNPEETWRLQSLCNSSLLAKACCSALPVLPAQVGEQRLKVEPHFMNVITTPDNHPPAAFMLPASLKPGIALTPNAQNSACFTLTLQQAVPIRFRQLEGTQIMVPHAQLYDGNALHLDISFEVNLNAGEGENLIALSSVSTLQLNLYTTAPEVVTEMP